MSEASFHKEEPSVISIGMKWSICTHRCVCPVLLQCVCSPGWTGELCQYVGDACLVQTNSCTNGATCITTSQPSSPPEYTCKCPRGFTGETSWFFLGPLTDFPPVWIYSSTVPIHRDNWSWGAEWVIGVWGKIKEMAAVRTVSTGLQSYVTTMYGEKLDLFLQ